MKNLISFFFLLFAFGACQTQESSKEELKDLTAEKKQALINELLEMQQADQQNRNFISFGTFNQDLIDSIDRIEPMEAYIKAKMGVEKELSDEQIDSLWMIQMKMDLQNTNRMLRIVETYGWLDTQDLDSLADMKLFLFHTPPETIFTVTKVLREEVKKGRMEPIDFAVYVDNMRVKAYGQIQLYGTGKMYDPAKQTLLPPIIANIDSTNKARKAIGLKELQVGEYRIAEQQVQKEI